MSNTVGRLIGGASGSTGLASLGGTHQQGMATAWPLSRYAAEGIAPALSLDFLNGQYRLGKTGSTFADAFTGTSPKLTYSTAAGSNSTMVNPEGKIVWAPHNLVSHSEDFADAAWSKVPGGTGSAPQVTSNAGTAPDGTNTATRLLATSGGVTASDYSILQITPGASGHSARAEIWVKSNTGSAQDVYFRCGSDLLNTVTATTTWQKVTYDQPLVAGTDFFSIGSRGSANGNATVDILIWGAHVYRSDLGGMHPVPGADTGFEYYVPTNGNAEYLPRVGHHVYNGSAWVNEGLLIESEDRTNFVTHSNDLSDASNTPTGLTITADADGWLSEIVEDTANTIHGMRSIQTSVSANWTATCFIKATGSGTRKCIVRIYNNGTGMCYALFDPTDGSVTDSGGSDLVSTHSQDMGDGVYRVGITCSHPLDAGGDGVELGMSNADTGEGGRIYTGDGSSSIYMGGLQIEEGSTPSSYMPTNGGTYTRTAQSLTVPANWYDADNPTYTGPELVVDGSGNWVGDFDVAADVSEWTGRNANTQLSLDGNRLRVEAGAADVAYAYKQLTADANKVYRVTLDYENVQGVVRVYAGIGTGTNTYYDSGSLTGSGSLDFVFVPTSADPYISVYASVSNTLGDASLFDNVSVRQVSAPQFAWPEPEYIGPELVTDFSTYADQTAFDVDWARGTGWTFDAATDTANCDGTQTGNTDLAFALSGTQEGKVYRVSTQLTRTAGSFRLGFFDGAGSLSEQFTESGEVVWYYVAARDNLTVVGRGNLSFEGSIDNISVREINPLSVSIQMDGRMTYADEDTGEQANLLNWNTGTEWVRVLLSTSGTTTGVIDANQREGGVTDRPNGVDTYTPGVLVPFNISSRHGSTFINAAVDGVARTADTTPTALPDLSGTDLQIAYDFMGTIGTFRQFAGDIGDAGLETSSDPGPSLSLTFDGSSTSSFVIN